jgi:hypothetical protein
VSTETVTAVDQDFSLERLERLLTADNPEVEWRHDVDFDPGCALQMAQMEHRLGVRATYYVMGRSDSYNPFGPKIRQVFKEIVGHGHTLGMHVDLEVNRGALVTTDELRQACDLDWMLFQESDLDMTRRVAFHAPPRSVYWRDVPGFEHALAPEWRDRYVADSRGRWRESPEDKLAAGGPVQLNLHSEWWWWTADLAASVRKIEAEKP